MKGVGRGHRRPPSGRSAELERGRDAYARRAWSEAHRALSLADRASSLETEDLEKLAWSSGLVGREDAFLGALERLHRAHLENGDPVRAARMAFWLGFRLSATGDLGRASGWFGRSERLLEQAGRPCVEQGYMLLPVAYRCLAREDCDGALSAAEKAGVVGERFEEVDLVALARSIEGVSQVWCSGFEPGFSWIRLPVFGEDGAPRHARGVVEGEPGLYFVGLRFLYAMSSTMVHGVGRDAGHVVKRIGSRMNVGAG